MRPRGLVAGAALLALPGACERDVGEPGRAYMPDMVDSVPFDSFAPNPITRDGRTLLPPPKGAVARGHAPLRYGPGPAEAAHAGRELSNPLPQNELVEKRGEVMFARTCSPCHGAAGEGDGLVATRFPRPPSLTAAHARALPDGQIFHVVTHGQGVMPGHAQQVAPLDRWALVHHVRRLQSAAGPAPGAAPAPGPAATATPSTIAPKGAPTP